MARHYWITVRPSEGQPFTREAITFAGAMDIARREVARWERGCVVRVESVPVRRGRFARIDFEASARGGHFEGEGSCSR